MEKRPILIQGAMDIEVQYIREKMLDYKKREIQGLEYEEGTIAGYPVILSKTGCGSVNITLATQIAIQTYQPIAILNQGTAGAHSILLHKGDLLVGTSSMAIDYYITKQRAQGEGTNPLEWDYTAFQKTMFEASPSLVDIAKEKAPTYIQGNVEFGVIGSGDCWNREWDRIQWFYEKYHTLCEDMETSKVYQVALHYQIPVIGIRVISNNERLGETFAEETANYSQQFVIEMIKGIIEKERQCK